MRALLRWLSALLACLALVARADDAGPAQKDYVPKAGSGRVVVMYPLTSFIQHPDDFVGKIEVPVLMLAGTADTYRSCCTIEKARELADAARRNPDVAPLFALHEYPGANHGFNMNTSHQRALVADSRDRAIAQLRQYLVDR